MTSLALSNAVAFQVSLQVIDARVGLGTHLTGVGSNARVTHGVFFQLGASGKALPALGADVRPFSGVNAHMKSAFTGHGEATPAHAAFVGPFPRVGAPVYLQLPGRNKGLPAVGTQVRLLSGVDPYVYLQIS